MSISLIKKQALSVLKGQWGLAVSLTLIVFLISSIIPSIFEGIFSGSFSNWLMQDTVPPLASLISTLVSIALIPLTVSALWFFLALVRMEGPKISDVFSVFKDSKTYFKLIGASLLIGIFVFLWSLLLLIPGIIKSLSYSQTYLLLKDHPEYSILEAITESRKRMNGYKWQYFLLNLSFIGWAILSIITLGIGFLWLSPYISTATATFYNELISYQDRYKEEEPI
ncbi:DUF975 family protein [Bacillus sp. T3]|uniref:DUF975 family protein n=1 Tax=Bacillus sp. T3 TaxID=467262 RepID=UPI0029816DA0|nr:DUF975 family protein [Bacillus sp. T3]